ncbi:uncharacterized protein LOC108676299 [Hyalella azteca]|uniref:Uncharacterized protein LOC108676299 n=1 Tax=Hyalella azteca TaxID=294128 RepID=A0A8B7P182_HYAAZ|nr:uncharacterized protein LOC108676299 [Hyalella azteca]
MKAKLELVVCLFWSTLAYSVSASSTSDVVQKFELAGVGKQSRLFSACQSQANSFEGSIFSVAVTDALSYQRFTPNQSRPMNWTEIRLGGDSGVLQCIMAAGELKPWMIKYEGKCLATFDDVYLSHEEKSCDVPQEVVYVITGFNMYKNVSVPFFSFYDWCHESLPTGIVGPVGEDSWQLHPPLNCCGDGSYAYGAGCYEFVQNSSSFCEATAQCKSMGMTFADYRFFETQNLAFDVDYYLGSLADKNVAVDYRRGVDGVWRWPTGETEAWEWATPPDQDHGCAIVHLAYDDPLMVPARCGDHVELALCLEPVGGTLARC